MEMVLWHNRIWICGRYFGCLQFFVVKGFMKTCLFLVIGEHEGLPLCNNGCEHGKAVEDVSKARMSTSSLVWRVFQFFFSHHFLVMTLMLRFKKHQLQILFLFEIAWSSCVVVLSTSLTCMVNFTSLEVVLYLSYWIWVDSFLFPCCSDQELHAASVAHANKSVGSHL